MRIRIFLLLVLCTAFLWLAGCDEQEQRQVTEQPSKKMTTIKKIVALGDSLTAGFGVDYDQSYPALLQKRLDAEGYAYRVVNAGVSGETTSGTLRRLDWIMSQDPDIVILEIGANDGLRGIETTLVEENLDTILQRLTEEGVIVVFAGMKMVWNLGASYTDSFNEIYPRLAQKHGAVFMPFFLEGVAAESEFNQADGIHPNAAGYRRIVDTIYPYVIEAIEKDQQR